ncbi:MAG: hypothetical protein V3W32_06845 [Gemmatimonadota bacterium]
MRKLLLWLCRASGLMDDLRYKIRAEEQKRRVQTVEDIIGRLALEASTALRRAAVAEEALCDRKRLEQGLADTIGRLNIELKIHKSIVRVLKLGEWQYPDDCPTEYWNKAAGYAEQSFIDMRLREHADVRRKSVDDAIARLEAAATFANGEIAKEFSHETD